MSSGEQSSNSKGDIEHELYEFIRDHCKKDLVKILEHHEESEHFPVPLSFIYLSSEFPRTAKRLLHFPDDVLTAGNRAACKVLHELRQQEPNKNEWTFKRNVHMRIHSLPDDSDDASSFPATFHTYPGCAKAGSFVSLVGKVVKMTSKLIVEFKKEYQCSKCKNIKVVQASLSRYYIFSRTITEKCDSLCVGAKLLPLDDDEAQEITLQNAHRFKDYREIKIQEVTKKDLGVAPKVMWVVLEDDLVGSCKPGDDVVISGKLLIRVKPFRPSQSIEMDLALHANHVLVRNDQRCSVIMSESMINSFTKFWETHENCPYEGRNMIVRSFCPKVYGMYLVKLAFCVVLAGGVPKKTGNVSVRGDSHLLLVGDPGTGKSQLLKYASKLIPRAIFTTGTGTTTAGLTVSVAKEDGTWHFEPGALVLANDGLCCIDEFSNIKQHDRVSIHEAMEQQTISVAKVGMVEQFSTKCTVIAATNPKFSKYDQNEDMELNVGLPSPLLSRFDLVIVLKDAENEAWDELLADFTLGGIDVFNLIEKNAIKEGSIWDSEKLRSYLIYIKLEKQPVMTREAESVLNKYYILQRHSGSRNIARTTVRLLESLIRLAEGHAKLMFREQVQVHDAIIAITLAEASMQSSALIKSIDSLHVEFPDDPIAEYYNQASKILELLGFPDLWKAEKEKLESYQKKRRSASLPQSPRMPVPLHSQGSQRCGGSKTSAAVTSKRPESNQTTNFPDTILEKLSDCHLDNVVPKDFFTDGLDKEVPCSCRIVTSTQISNPQGQKSKKNDDYVIQSVSPIAPGPSSSRFAGLLHTPIRKRGIKEYEDAETEPIMSDDCSSSSSPEGNKRKCGVMLESDDEEVDVGSDSDMMPPEKKMKSNFEAETANVLPSKIDGNYQIEKLTSSQVRRKKDVAGILSRFRRKDDD